MNWRAKLWNIYTTQHDTKNTSESVVVVEKNKSTPSSLYRWLPWKYQLYFIPYNSIYTTSHTFPIRYSMCICLHMSTMLSALSHSIQMRWLSKFWNEWEWWNWCVRVCVYKCSEYTQQNPSNLQIPEVRLGWLFTYTDAYTFYKHIYDMSHNSKLIYICTQRRMRELTLNATQRTAGSTNTHTHTCTVYAYATRRRDNGICIGYLSLICHRCCIQSRQARPNNRNV